MEEMEERTFHLQDTGMREHVACAPSHPLHSLCSGRHWGAVLGPCSWQEPSKASRWRCWSSTAPDWKESLCGPAVAWQLQEGQVFNHCRPFILHVVYSLAMQMELVNTYVPACWVPKACLCLPSRLLQPPAKQESRKATEHAVTWGMGGLSPVRMGLKCIRKTHALLI